MYLREFKKTFQQLLSRYTGEISSHAMGLLQAADKYRMENPWEFSFLPE
jgi:hypothetical protein